MRRTIALGTAMAAALFAGAAAPALGKTADGPLSVVRAFNADVGKGDLAGASALFAPGTSSIIDEFTPFTWIGPNALKDWATSFAADSAARGVTDPVVTTGSPMRVKVDGDKAYVVIHATFDYKEKGVKTTEASVWTFTLEKSATGWLIRAWSWGGKKPKPVAETAAQEASKPD